MSVLKRGGSQFWYVQFQLNGRTYIKSSKSTDRKIAELLESQWKKQLMTEQVLGIRNRLPTVEAFDLFLEAKRELPSFRNLIRYVDILTKFLVERRHIDEVTTGDLERLKVSMTQKGYSQQMVKHVIGTLRGSWKVAKRHGYLTSELEFPSVKVNRGKLRYLSFDEEKRLLTAIDPKRVVKGLPAYKDRTDLMRREMHDLYDFFVLLLDTGARYGELSSLKWSQINIEQGTIALWRPKVRNESILYMTDRARTIFVRRYREKVGDYVFANRSGGARSYVGTTLRRTFKRAGLADCSPHTLRHTHATRLIQNGLSIYEVKEILGHSDIKTTMRYAHIEQAVVSKKARGLINRLNRQQAAARSTER